MGDLSELKQWENTKAMIGNGRVEFGPYFTYQLRNTPRRILYSLSYHKFGAKIIGPGKRVLEVGCGEGFASSVLAEFASSYLGIDLDAEAIAEAQKTFGSENKRFIHSDILARAANEQAFDAVASFDVIEHIFPENEERFLEKVASSVHEHGICIIGTPNEVSAKYASAVTNAGHVNLYSASRLRESLRRHFKTVLIFSANDEIVHTGYYPMAHYLIAVGIGRG